MCVNILMSSNAMQYSIQYNGCVIISCLMSIIIQYNINSNNNNINESNVSENSKYNILINT